jgi:hypothetical protein
VLGKLSFATLSGGLIDTYGLIGVYVLFVLLAAATLPVLAYMPDLQNCEVENEKEFHTEENKEENVLSEESDRKQFEVDVNWEKTEENTVRKAADILILDQIEGGDKDKDV